MAAAGAKMPAGGAKMPAGGAKMAAGGAKMPAGGAKMAAGGAKMPAGGAKMAAGGAKMPAGGAKRSPSRNLKTTYEYTSRVPPKIVVNQPSQTPKPRSNVTSGTASTKRNLNCTPSLPVVAHWNSNNSNRKRSSGSIVSQTPPSVVVRLSQGSNRKPTVTISPSRAIYLPKVIRDSGSGGWNGVHVIAHQPRPFWGGGQHRQTANMAYQTEVIIDSQPQGVSTSYNFSNEGNWNSGVCDCFEDMSICLCATFIPCFLVCRVAEQAGECCCLPYLPGALIAMRTGVRERYHIQGSICEDWMVMACCPLCGLCQLSRELNRRT